MSDDKQEQDGDIDDPSVPPDDREPSAQRQAKLEADYQANVAAGRPPYDKVRIETRGELLWVLHKRNWVGGVGASSGEQRADLSGADLASVRLQRIHLCEANLTSAFLLRANLSEAMLARANLTKAVLFGATLADTNLVSAQLNATDLGGANLTGAHMPGAKLQSAVLIGANLTHVNMGVADLTNARMLGATLSGAWLRKADLRGTDLAESLLDVKTSLVGVKLDVSTRLADVVWNGAPLTQVDWKVVPTLGDETEARRESDDNSKHKGRETRLGDYATAARAYRQLTVALRAQGMNDDADRYAYRAQLMQREVFRWNKQWGGFLFSWLLFLMSGYGYRLWRILATYAAVALGFTVIYWALGVHSFAHESGVQALWDSFLVSLSAIHGRATFEQLGAWTPPAWWAAVESVFGIVIEGVFVAMLIQRFFAR